MPDVMNLIAVENMYLRTIYCLISIYTVRIYILTLFQRNETLHPYSLESSSIYVLKKCIKMGNI